MTKRTLLTGIIAVLPFLAMAASLRIFVSPAGSDVQAGTSVAPLKTLQAAVRIAERETERPVEILLQPGTYPLAETVTIRRATHTHPLTIKPASLHGEVVLSGGIEVPRTALRPITDPEQMARVQSAVREQVLELDLSSLGVPWEGLHASGFGRASYTAWTELFEDGEPATLARWPNEGWKPIGKVIKAGTGEYVKDAPLPAFHYNDPRPDTWKEEPWLRGYFTHGYADDMIRVARIDQKNRAFHMAEQTLYGVSTGAPWRVWCALNLLEEIDRPGEMVLDEKRAKLYYLPRSEKSSLTLSVLETPLLAVLNCANVRLEGLTFAYGRGVGVYLEGTENVTLFGCMIRDLGNVGICVGRGVPTTPPRPDLTAQTDPTQWQPGNLLWKTYDDPLFDRNAGKHNHIVNCVIDQVGAGGISLGGGVRRTLERGDNVVENCRITRFNRIEKSYRPAIWMEGVGNRISKCDISDAPSMAILFHGNDHLIEKCRIQNVCQEVNDQGAIYYGRDPSERGNVIRYCYFHKLSPRHSVIATYHDDGACGSEVYGNIYHEAGSMPVLIGGGSDHIYRHNLFVDCPLGVHLDNRLQGWARPMVAPNGIIAKRLERIAKECPVYHERYPELKTYASEQPGPPRRVLMEGNLFYNIRQLVHGNAAWATWKDNWVTTEDPGFIDPKNPLKGFRKDAPIYQKIPGFPRLPFADIGCSLPPSRQ